MAKLGGTTGFGKGFMTPAKPNIKGSVAGGQGGLSGKGNRMNEKQGSGGVTGKSVGQVQTGSGAGDKMDNKNGKGVVNKSVGQIQTSTGSAGQRMGSQGQDN